MRVLHLTTEYPPLIYGGLGTAVGGLVHASAAAGLEVAVLLVGHGSSQGYVSNPLPASDQLEVGCEWDGSVLVCSVPHADAIRASVEFARCWRPDVIHVHVFWLAHVTARMREATGVPLVYTVHSLDRAEYELGEGPSECLTQWPIQSDLIAAADLIIALTSDEQQLISEYCPAARARIRVAGNGIFDTPHARNCARHRPTQGDLTILYTGRFVDRKGIGELLLAAPDFLAEAPSARLVMAGGHRDASAADMAAYWLPETCQAYRDRIYFTGWLTPSRLAEWYAVSDILVVPSWYEPFGMVILEGMLYGLAIVASDVGGPREILRDEKTGLFCRPKDVASLGSQVKRLIHDRGLRCRLGTRAAQEVRSHWSFRSVVQSVNSVYVEAAARQKPIIDKRAIRCA